jgi:hypothetical protein
MCMHLMKIISWLLCTNQLIINYWVGCWPIFSCWASVGPFFMLGQVRPITIKNIYKKNISDVLAYFFYPFWLISIYIFTP